MFDKVLPYLVEKQDFYLLTVWLCFYLPTPKIVLIYLMLLSTPGISCLAIFI